MSGNYYEKRLTCVKVMTEDTITTFLRQMEKRCIVRYLDWEAAGLMIFRLAYEICGLNPAKPDFFGRLRLSKIAAG